MERLEPFDRDAESRKAEVATVARDGDARILSRHRPRPSPTYIMIPFRRWLRAPIALIVVAPISLSAQTPLTVASPDGRTQVTVAVEGGGLRYAVRHAGANVITPSRLGFAFKGAAVLGDSVRITDRLAGVPERA